MRDKGFVVMVDDAPVPGTGALPPLTAGGMLAGIAAAAAANMSGGRMHQATQYLASGGGPKPRFTGQRKNAAVFETVQAAQAAIDAIPEEHRPPLLVVPL